jgi:peptidoglycan-associated lipoprotein
MTTLLRAVSAIFVAGVLAGCASKVPLQEGSNVPVETRSPTGSAGAGAGGQGAGTAQSQVTPVTIDPNAQQAGANLPRVVLFDFDSFVVKDEYRPVVETHARRLTADRKRRLVLEGHTDERGGREYNLALGQKRAEAVAKALALLGAQDSQMEAVSFGKERPAVQGSDETAWAQNRRVELKDR